jgi:heme/copper-type cytochrome/quinol oxidase subunit 3
MWDIFLLITMICAVTFIYFQYLEYKSASFNIALGIYGSVFFILTGFHGGHVILGTILLFIGYIRGDHWTSNDHVYLLGAIWYYHFVDVVWIALYISIYVWGG